jgi:phage N-6-adenine-methyltransferase
MIAAGAATHSQGWRVSTSISARENWGTPPAIYLPLDREFQFTLDVAADGNNAQHIRFLTKDTDALTVSWAGECVFCNPPYGRQITRWLRKAILERDENQVTSVFLVPARTSNAWFHDLVLPHAAEVRFIRGRLSFTIDRQPVRRKGGAPFASMVLVFRPGVRVVPVAQLLMPFVARSFPPAP